MVAHAVVSLGRPTFLHCRGVGKELRICLHGFLLFAVETQRHQVLSRYFPKSRCFLVVQGCMLQNTSPVSLQLLNHGTGSCDWERKGSSVQYMRTSGWALQNFSGMRGGTRHERLELHLPSLPLHGRSG